jgi:methyl-accepting chemotaxis protein
MALFLCTIGFVGYYSSEKLADKMSDMYSERLLPIKWLNLAAAQTRAIEALTYELFVTNDPNKELANVNVIK